MKNLILFLAAVCYAAMMQAQEYIPDVRYIDENGVEQTCEQAMIVRRSSSVVSLETGWYLLAGDIAGGIVCNGDVHLILLDGHTVTITREDYHAGIEVSGEGNTLTIYGQAKQTGKLEVTGGINAAGIGGGMMDPGSNITINSGIVTAKGGGNAAGIGGGYQGSGSNITINGGIVTANGEENAAGIGGGFQGSGSNITINGGIVTATGGSNCSGIGSGYGKDSNGIFVADNVKVLAGKSNVQNVIEHNSISDDIASKLAGKQYVETIDLAPAFKAIDNAIGDSEDEDILNVANTAKTNIVENLTTVSDVESASNLAVAKINALKEILPLIGNDANVRNEKFISDIIAGVVSAETVNDVNTKKTQAVIAVQSFLTGRSSVLGTMGTPQTGCAAVEVTKGDKTIKLYNPDKVEFIKVSTEE